MKRLADRLVLQVTGRIVEQAAIKLVPDRRDVPALLGPQNVSRAANFEIPHGDLETGTQLAEFLDRLSRRAAVELRLCPSSNSK